MAKKAVLGTDEYKGVRDFYPEEKAVQNYIFDVWRKTMELFGYAEYDASLLEPTELYEAKSSEEIINEQTYSFIDRGGRKVTLRPEMTPTVARMVAKKKRELPFPLRLYSIPNLFRYERPQRGRAREHWQLNADIFGVSSKEADIEIITVSHQIMKNFGLNDKQFQIRISSRKLINAIFSEWHELDEERSRKMMKLIDRKNKMREEEFENKTNEIAGKAFNFLSLSKEDEVYEEAMALPLIREAKNELDEVISDLQKRGINNIIFDPELIRGFDYYSGVIFEVFDNHPDNKRALFGGGRYESLVSLFGEEDITACGFGMGDVTIWNALETYDLVPEKVLRSKTQVYICPISDEDIHECESLADYLRENKINTAVHIPSRKLGDELKQAEKQKIEWALIIGESERKNQIFKLKNLFSKEEFQMTKQEFLSKIKG